MAPLPDPPENLQELFAKVGEFLADIATKVLDWVTNGMEESNAMTDFVTNRFVIGQLENQSGIDLGPQFEEALRSDPKALFDIIGEYKDELQNIDPANMTPENAETLINVLTHDPEFTSKLLEAGIADGTIPENLLPEGMSAEMVQEALPLLAEHKEAVIENWDTFQQAVQNPEFLSSPEGMAQLMEMATENPEMAGDFLALASNHGMLDNLPEGMDINTLQAALPLLSEHGAALAENPELMALLQDPEALSNPENLQMLMDVAQENPEFAQAALAFAAENNLLPEGMDAGMLENGLALLDGHGELVDQMMEQNPEMLGQLLENPQEFLQSDAGMEMFGDLLDPANAQAVGGLVADDSFKGLVEGILPELTADMPEAQAQMLENILMENDNLGELYANNPEAATQLLLTGLASNPDTAEIASQLEATIEAQNSAVDFDATGIAEFSAFDPGMQNTLAAFMEMTDSPEDQQNLLEVLGIEDASDLIPRIQEMFDAFTAEPPLALDTGLDVAEASTTEQFIPSNTESLLTPTELYVS